MDGLEWIGLPRIECGRIQSGGACGKRGLDNVLHVCVIYICVSESGGNEQEQETAKKKGRPRLCWRQQYQRRKRKQM